MTADAAVEDAPTLAAITRRVAELRKLDAPATRDFVLLADQLVAARDAANGAEASADHTVVEIACDIMRMIAADIASGQIIVGADQLNELAKTLLVFEGAAYEQAGKPAGGYTTAEELKAFVPPATTIGISASAAPIIAETTCLIMRMLAADIASGQVTATPNQLHGAAYELRCAVDGIDRTHTATESAAKSLEMAQCAAQLAAIAVGTDSTQRDGDLARDCVQRAAGIVEWAQRAGRGERAELASFGALLAAGRATTMTVDDMTPSLACPTTEEMPGYTIAEAASSIMYTLSTDILIEEVTDTAHHLNLLADAARVLAVSTRRRLAAGDLGVPPGEGARGHGGATAHSGELRPAVAAQLAAQLAVVAELAGLAAVAAQVEALMPELSEIAAVADKVALVASEFGDAPPGAGLAVLGAVFTAAVTAAEFASHTDLEISRREAAARRSTLTTHEIAAREAAVDARAVAGSIVVRTTGLILVAGIEYELATREHLEELALAAEELADGVRRVAREPTRQTPVASPVETHRLAPPMTGVDEVSHTTRRRAHRSRHRDWQVRRVCMYAPDHLVEIAKGVGDIVRIAKSAVELVEVSADIDRAPFDAATAESSESLDRESLTSELYWLATAAHKQAATMRRDSDMAAERRAALAAPALAIDASAGAERMSIEATCSIMSMIADDIGSARAAGIGRAPPEEWLDDHHAASAALLDDLAAAADWLLAAVDERVAAEELSLSRTDVSVAGDVKTDARRQACRAAQITAEKARLRPHLALMLDQLAVKLNGLITEAPRAVNSELRPTRLSLRAKRTARAARAALAAELRTFLTELPATAAQLAELAETLDRTSLAATIDQRASQLAETAEVLDSASFSVRAADLVELAEAIVKAPLAAAVAQRAAQLVDTSDAIDSAPLTAGIVHRAARPPEIVAAIENAVSGVEFAVLAAVFPVMLAAEAIADLIIAEIASRSSWGVEEVEVLCGAEDITTLADVIVVETTRRVVSTVAVALTRREQPAATPDQLEALADAATVLATASRRELDSVRAGLSARQ